MGHLEDKIADKIARGEVIYQSELDELINYYRTVYGKERRSEFPLIDHETISDYLGKNINDYQIYGSMIIAWYQLYNGAQNISIVNVNDIIPKNPKPVRVSVPVGGIMTHTFGHAWLWSVRKHKFLKGFCHKGQWWACDYFLYPGFYLLWSFGGYLDTRGATFTLSKIAVTYSGGTKRIADIYHRDLPHTFANTVITDDDAPGSIKEFMRAINWEFHAIADSPTGELVYDEGEIGRVQKYIDEYINALAEY